MTNEELKIKLTELLPAATFEEGSEWTTIQLSTEDFSTSMQLLYADDLLYMNYLFCLTCVDWKTHLTMVYHLTSTTHRCPLVIKVKLENSKPEIATVSHIWKTAVFHEREVYEMFGVNFLNHPDLRLLILPDGWEGKNPMRKDFEDPVNMIRL